MAVPTFSISVNVSDINGTPPTSGQSFTFQVTAQGDGTVVGTPVTVTGTNSTGFMSFNATQAAQLQTNYDNAIGDNTYHYRHDMMIIWLWCTPGSGPITQFTNLAGTIREDVNGVATPFTAKFWGPHPTINGAIVGFAVYYEVPGTNSFPTAAGTTGNIPRAVVLAAFHQRFKTLVQSHIPTPAALPVHITIVDRFIGGDDDYNNWRIGYDTVDNLGANAMGLPQPLNPSTTYDPIYRTLVNGSARIRKIARFNYSQAASLPWYPAADGTTIGDDSNNATWASQELSALQAAGWSASDLVHITLEDEPGWNFPDALNNLISGTAGSAFGDGVRSEAVRTQWLNDFRSYIQAQGFTASQVQSGATDFSTVFPIGPDNQGGTIEQRRLYVLSVRWLANASDRFHVDITNAITTTFPGIHAAVEWNHASSRVICPTGAPSANGTGGTDWLETAALGAVTDLQPEDYNYGRDIFTVAHTVAKSAAGGRQGTLSRGGILFTPVTSTGNVPGTQTRKEIMAVGHGAKDLYRYIFGPIDVGVDGYAEEMLRNPGFIDDINASNQLLAAADAYVGPGQRLASQVAILNPISSELFDAGAGDLATTRWWSGTVDYLLEAEATWTALAHDHIYADWLREEDVASGKLTTWGYNVLYVTGPNIPSAVQSAISTWVNNGGILVTVPGTGTFDQFNDPLTTVANLGGLTSPARTRQNAPALDNFGTENGTMTPQSWTVSGIGGSDTAFGIPPASGTGTPWREAITAAGTVEATFTDNSTPAICNVTVGSGKRYHFSFFPASTYIRAIISQPTTGSQMPTSFSSLIRSWIARPVRTFSNYLPPVEITSQPLVDAPMLQSGNKVAVSLVNQTNSSITGLTGKVRPGATVTAITSAATGTAVSYTNTADGTTFGPLNLNVADILMVDTLTPLIESFDTLPI